MNKRIMPLEGFQPAQVSTLRSLENATQYLLTRLYQAVPKRQRGRTSELDERDRTIRSLFVQGNHPNEIASRFGITPERVYQIIKSTKA